MSPELLETIRTSPLTPWIGGAVLIFLLFSLVKFIAKTLGKLVITAVIAVAGLLGWNWLGEPDARTFTDIRKDWFASIKNTDFSRDSIQALVKDTSRLLKEATETSRAKGREVTKDMLVSAADALKQKIAEASARGETDAKQRFQGLYDQVQAKLGQ